MLIESWPLRTATSAKPPLPVKTNMISQQDLPQKGGCCNHQYEFLDRNSYISQSLCKWARNRPGLSAIAPVPCNCQKSPIITRCVRVHMEGRVAKWEEKWAIPVLIVGSNSTKSGQLQPLPSSVHSDLGLKQGAVGWRVERNRYIHGYNSSCMRQVSKKWFQLLPFACLLGTPWLY